MDFWKVLEIDPTDNISIVKKAYAKNLKLHHPEDDPEGYQTLREAYDSALKYLKNNKNSSSVNERKVEKHEEIETFLNHYSWEDIKQEPPYINIFEEVEEKPTSFEEVVEKFINKTEILYNNFSSRINIDNWIVLLNSEVMWYMGDKQLLSNKMLEFLIENHYLPEEVWKLLEDNFNWNGQKEYLYEKYDEKFIDYLFKQINDNNGLRYYFFKEVPTFDYDTFLEYREEAFDALSNDDFEYAEEFINNAYNIYTDDPDLLLMKGECYLHKEEIDKSLHIFETIIQMDNGNIYARFYRAKILYDKGQIYNALDDCKFIEAHNFDNSDFCLLAAKCYFEFQEFDKAKKLLLQASYTDSIKKAEVHALLRKINLQLANKLREESRKDKKNKEIKLELNKLYRELGMLDNKQLIRKLSWKMAGRLFVCLLILVFQVMIIHSGMEGMGFRDINSIKNIGQFIMVKDKDHLIKDSQDINNLPGEISTVHGKLTHAGFMGLYRIPTKDKNKKPITVYLTSKEAHAKDLYGDMNGYVCIGTLGDKKVIMIVDYEEADQIYKTQTLDFRGIIRSMPADSLVSQVKKGCITDKFESRFITDKLIDTKVKVSSIRQVILGIVSVMLLVQVLIIIQGLISGYMLVRANRKILNK